MHFVKDFRVINIYQHYSKISSIFFQHLNKCPFGFISLSPVDWFPEEGLLDDYDVFDEFVSKRKLGYYDYMMTMNKENNVLCSGHGICRDYSSSLWKCDCSEGESFYDGRNYWSYYGEIFVLIYFCYLIF